MIEFLPWQFECWHFLIKVVCLNALYMWDSIVKMQLREPSLNQLDLVFVIGNCWTFCPPSPDIMEYACLCAQPLVVFIIKLKHSLWNINREELLVLCCCFLRPWQRGCELLYCQIFCTMKVKPFACSLTRSHFHLKCVHNRSCHLKFTNLYWTCVLCSNSSLNLISLM